MTPHVHEDEQGLHPPLPINPAQIQMERPPENEAIVAGMMNWLAREFVGGMIAYARATNVENLDDFLADKCGLLAVRLAAADSEVQVLRTQVMTLSARLADCPCHDETSELAGDSVPSQDELVTRNGDGK